MIDDGEVSVCQMDETGQKLANDLNTKGFNCEYVVRAPGRVNLIGEHIDYNGYPVLPMALERSIYIAVAFTSDESLKLSSTDPEYRSAVVSLSDAAHFGSNGPPSTIYWFHYVLCGFHGIADYVKSKSIPWTPPSLALHVGGPEYGGLWPAAGLSSSSALVVASVLAVMRASGLQIRRSELADLCTRCERYIGMQGGGMDQTTSLFGMAECAILIDFSTPQMSILPVPIPSDVVFVIAHSGVHSRKAATSMYNERVSECRLASRLLIANSPNPDILNTQEHPCLGYAQLAWEVDSPGNMLVESETGRSIVDRFLPNGKVTKDQILQHMTCEELNSCLTATTQQMQFFYLNDRAKHVFSEAERTLAFFKRSQCLDGLGEVPNHNHILASLMNESQQSCAKLYDCSSSELDDLVNVCRSAGALASRLTGAGWGGCTVSLVEKDAAEEFMQKVRQEYYIKRGMVTEADRLIFISKPGPPACIMLSA